MLKKQSPSRSRNPARRADLVNFTVRIERALYGKLKKEIGARTERISIQAFVEAAIIEKIDRAANR
jgi:hypothetical protein